MLPPRWFYTLPLRLRSLLNRRTVERELDEELRFHIDRHTEIQISKGLSRDEARRQALLALGGLIQQKEICRGMRRTQPLEILLRDLRHGLRALKSSPLFTLVAISSLALGIGANTAVFTLMYSILWKPLPVRDPGQLVQLMRTGVSEPDSTYSWYAFRQLGEPAQVAGDLIAQTPATREKFGLSIDSPERVIGQAVSANYFRALRVASLRGRTFEPDDDNIAGGRHVAVLSFSFWAARFRSDSSILGGAIYYDETPYTVVGVAEPGFAGVQPGTAVDIWVPVTAAIPSYDLQAKNGGFLKLFARLDPTAAPSAVETIWNARFRAYVARDLLPRYPLQDRWPLQAQHITLRPARSGLAGVFDRYRKPVFLLMGIATLVLLIACANIASLVLARNTARRGEIELRVALGASRSRIVAQLLIESLLIAFFGASAGIALATAAAKALIALLPGSGAAPGLDSRPDGIVLGVTIAVAFLTAILFGLLPALRASHTGVDSGLRTGARVTGRSMLGRALVAGQLALSLILLIAAGLFLGTIRNLKATDLGFRPEHVTAFDVSFPRGTDDSSIHQTYTAILDRLTTTPGVVTASHVWPSVYSTFRWQRGVAVEGRPFLASQRDFACGVSVGPNFFETLGMTLLTGRYLNARDQLSGVPAMVVNESFASAYIAGRSPLGRHVIVDGAPSQNWEIVGVVRDARHYGVREKVCRTTYVPAGQAPKPNAFTAQGAGSFLLRATADLPSAATSIRAAISAAGRGTQLETLQPLETAIDDMVSRERMLAVLSTVFAVLALLLAAIGLYGVMAYIVSQRTAELGIRMALGATPGTVQWLLVKQTAGLILIGVTFGIAAALPLARLTSGLLYGIRPGDETIFAEAALVLTAAAALAGYLPARQASRVDPVISLRRE